MTKRAIARRNALVLRHLPMVDNIAASFAVRLPAWILLEDLKSAGHLGLVTAATSYDAARDPSERDKFVAWAVCKIRFAIMDHVRYAYKHSGSERSFDFDRDADSENTDPFENTSSDNGAQAAAVVAQCEAAQRVNRIHLVALPPRERKVVELHYKTGHNMQIVARKMKTSPTKVFQMRASALSTVRAALAA